MKFGVLLLLVGALPLAACGSHSSAPTKPTSTAGAVATRYTPVTDPTSTPAPRRTPVRIPRNASPFDRGSAYLAARNYKAAIGQFQLSIRRNHRVSDSYANIGTAYLEQSKPAAAFRSYRSAVSLQGRNPAYLYYAAYAALYAQDFRATVAYASRFIALQPANPAGYHLRFLAYGRLLEHKMQVKDARAYVKLQPRDPESYNDLGIALTNDGKLRQAVQAFTRAIQLRPAYVSYYTNRAMAENLNRQPDAVLHDLYTARSLAKDRLTRQQIDQAITNFKKHLKH